MLKTLKRLVLRTEAQDIIEYALLAAAISIAAVVILLAIGVNVGSAYQQVNTSVTAAKNGDAGASGAPASGDDSGAGGDEGGNGGGNGNGNGRGNGNGNGNGNGGNG